MKKFLNDDFLLGTPTAVSLYQNYARMEKVPIIDYHCHINPQEIYEDRKFENITQVWLGGDHYKWRQMRTCGVEEKYITGDATDYEKFEKWAWCMPKLIGNPLYHWSHLELKYYFGYEGTLNPKTAPEVWELTREKLNSPGFSARNLIIKSNVKVVCTTDDPIDSLNYHELIKNDESFNVHVLPAWRPDKAMNIEKPGFAQYMEELSRVAGIPIKSFEDMQLALHLRMDHFAKNGCCISDHGLEFVMYEPYTKDDIDVIFREALNGEPISRKEELQYKTAFMVYAAREYNKRGWVMQLHYGCKRDNNTFMFDKIGPDTGFDCINDYTPSAQLANFLNALARTDELPKTIVYSLNPSDNAAIGTIIGCFQGEGVRNKVQQGSAWWFNDHIIGMSDQLKSFASLSCLGNFVGMLTDSRSFLSYTRHDYFRRILCDYVGGLVERGEYPNDEEYLKEIIYGISYGNAVEYFGFEELLKDVNVDV